MPKGPTKRRPQTRARMLDAALEAFADLGFGGAKIDEICKRAGYTTGAFYSNFTSKDELFFALFEEHARRQVERLEQRLSELGPKPSPEQLAEIGAVGHEDRRWFLVSTEFTLYAIRNPAAASLLAEYDARLRASIEPLLTRVFAQAGRDLPVDVQLLARMAVAMREGGLAQSLIEPDALAHGLLDRALMSILLGGSSMTSAAGD